MSALSLGRLMSLGDNIFSVAMTLLAFSIHLPDAPSAQISWTELNTALPEIASFAFGFLVLGQYWIAHHNTFHQLRRSDRPFIWLNLVFLLGVAFIPVATATLGRHPHAPLAIAVFGAALIFTSVASLLLWWYASRHRKLVDHDIDPDLVHGALLRIASPIPIQIASIVLAYAVDPLLAIAAYVLLPLVAVLPTKVDTYWRGGHSAAEPPG
jgi:uncharacterized membrane protein